MGIMIDVEVYCTCGNELEVTYKMKDDILVITTEPCEDCVDAGIEDGKEEGRSEGYDEGYSEGLMDAKEEGKERAELTRKITELEDKLANIGDEEE